jgi:hypothetical protein
MKTKSLNKFLQQIRDALPERIRERMSGKADRADHLAIPLVGWVGLNYYGGDEPDSVFLCFTGFNASRTRTYQIKNGVLKTKRLVKVATEKFDKRDEFEKEYAREQEESNRRFREARKLEPITFPKVKTGKAFELIVGGEASYLAGGAKLTHKGSGRKAEIWAVDEDTVQGEIPIGPISVAKLNEILKLLG